MPRVTIIYERQSQAEEITDEREVKHGRGRPRKQYLIQKKPSRIAAGRLTAPELFAELKGNRVVIMHTSKYGVNKRMNVTDWRSVGRAQLTNYDLVFLVRVY